MNSIFRRGIIVILLSFLPSLSFSQEGPENVFAINLGYLIPSRIYQFDIGLGFWYERYIMEYFTIGADVGYRYTKVIDEFDVHSASIVPHFRCYPLGSATSGFFIGLGTGYTFEYLKILDIGISNHIVYLIPNLGYKFIFAERFMVEPSIGYKLNYYIVKTEGYDYSGYDFTEFNIENIYWGILFGFGI
ncbi:MAG: hypothetical protein LBD20_02055 [Spirochaetaceae bacterium]|jgi:hypothetical protein|nr:hypothetical protein [Spirochaetaceae bacterium]